MESGKKKKMHAIHAKYMLSPYQPQTGYYSTALGKSGKKLHLKLNEFQVRCAT